MAEWLGNDLNDAYMRLVQTILVAKDDVPKDTSYVIKKITTCPDVGYFFRRESNPNGIEPGLCYLCFCQDDGTALCWKRENRRCDSTGYKHNGIAKRDTRVRRSPFSFGDFFLKDAIRDFGSKKPAEECKPFESTFSEDCPPADWCIGCTVCDCNTSGRWECHLLSFCPDKNNKTKAFKRPQKMPKKHKSHTKSLSSKHSNPTKTTPRTTKPKKPTNNSNTSLKRPNRQVQKTTKKPVRKSKQIKKNNKPSPKPLIIHKGQTRKPNGKPKMNFNLKDSDRAMITKEIMKNVLSVMHRMMNNSQAINNRLLKVLPTPRNVQKRSMDKKKQRKYLNKFIPPKSKKSKYNKTVPPKHYYQQQVTKRFRRQIPDVVVNMTEINKNDNNIVEAGKQLPSIETALNDTTTVNNYYKYVVITETPISNTTDYHIIYAEHLNNSDENEVTRYSTRDTEIDIVTTEGFTNNLNVSKENRLIEEKPISVEYTTVVNSFKGGMIDIIKNDNKATKNLKVNNKTLTHVNDSSSFENITTTMKNKVHSKDVTRIIVSPHLKKQATSNKFNTPKENPADFTNFTKTKPIHNEKSIKYRVFKKIADIQSMFKKLLSDFRTKNNYTKSTTVKPKRKKHNIMKYLKKFFRKVFRRRPGKGKMTNNATLKNHVVEAICEIFGNCVINKKDTKLVERKINELYKESNNIFRSIKIIKGLLHLIDINNTQVKSNSSRNAIFKDDIHKLNYILKNKYENVDQKLTENQITQIEYIKNNTHNFIQSVGKFANILNNIIAMLTKEVDKNKAEQRNRRNAEKDHFKNLFNNSSRNSAVINDFIKLKTILRKYNLIQNTFMRKMYETLNKFGNIPENNTVPQVSQPNTKDVNASIAIEKFSRNIIENLRKLKNLADMLNSKSRRKREIVGDENTVQYLLTLMEYMLKSSYSMDAAPVGDGIDLLIDAIKSAPDVEPARKKVLEAMTQKPALNETKSLSRVADDDFSDTKEDNVTVVPINSDNDVEEQTVYQSKEDNHGYHPVQKNIFEENTDIRSATYNNNFNEIVDTTIPYMANKSGKDQKDSSSSFDKFEFSEALTGKKFEVFSADMEDDDTSEVTSTTVATEVDVDIDRVVTTETQILSNEIKTDKVKLKNIKNEVSSESGESEKKRVSLDWLDEGYDQDGTEVKSSVENVTTTSSTVITTHAIAQKMKSRKNDDSVSTLTKESSDEYDRKNQAKLNAEHLMHQKQMDLLNSLDYGTEKTDLEDSAYPKDEPFASYYS